jgi:hypothetical protein
MCAPRRAGWVGTVRFFVRAAARLVKTIRKIGADQSEKAMDGTGKSRAFRMADRNAARF